MVEGVRKHEGELDEALGGRAGGEKHATRDGGGGVQRLPFPVVEKSAHRLRRLSGGRLLPYLRISLQVSTTSM